MAKTKEHYEYKDEHDAQDNMAFALLAIANELHLLNARLSKLDSLDTPLYDINRTLLQIQDDVHARAVDGNEPGNQKTA